MLLLRSYIKLTCFFTGIRGLDSAVALHYLKALRELSRSTGMTNIVSIYQASQEMWDKCFDRVIVIFEGHMVFSVS
jgi:ATP-binding cassette subfamily G (WHITE) protein 2 (SNQ2)